MKNISMSFSHGVINRSSKPVLDDVSVSVDRGETLGLMGDSGSGKTTLAKIAVRLINPDAGNVVIDGEDITRYDFKRMSSYRSRLQLVFQNPEGALNPEMTLGDSLREAVFKSKMRSMGITNAVDSLCAELGIKKGLLSRYPSQVSGGEIQRIALSRVLAMRPDYLFLDEPTSMLDASVQAFIFSVLRDHQKQFGTGMVLITHDLDIIRHMCDRVAVIDKGRLVGYGPTSEVLDGSDDGYIRRYCDNWNKLEKLTPFDDEHEGCRRFDDNP